MVDEGNIEAHTEPDWRCTMSVQECALCGELVLYLRDRAA
jgi:hypothetical protein